MKCNSCRHLWIHSPNLTNSYPEVYCMFDDTDLYGTKEDDVKDCKNYEKLSILASTIKECEGK